MKRNLLTRRVGPLMLARQNADDPTDPEWDEFLAYVAAHREEFRNQNLKLLVHTDGGAANAAQRKRLAATLGTTHARVAVVSDSIKVRFAGATIALFQRHYRQFSVSEMRGAYDHLGLTYEQRQLAETTLYELEAMLYADI
jgi:hypothetical protein